MPGRPKELRNFRPLLAAGGKIWVWSSARNNQDHNFKNHVRFLTRVETLDPPISIRNVETLKKVGDFLEYPLGVC